MRGKPNIFKNLFTLESIKRFLLIALFIVLLYFAYRYVAAHPEMFAPNNLKTIFQTYGLLGIFIAAIVANATLFFPVPLDIAVFFLGQFDMGFGAASPLAIGIFAGLGSAIGEMSGYIVGTLGIRGIEKLKRKELEQINKLQKRINKYGFSIIALAALTPFPFDLVGIAAGLIKFDPRRFFFACVVGKIARYVLVGYAGMLSLKALAFFLGVGS